MNQVQVRDKNKYNWPVTILLGRFRSRRGGAFLISVRRWKLQISGILLETAFFLL